MERSLQQFLTVAESGSISEAARLLNVTQPTITINVKNLEEKHGVTLFNRTPKGMTLTPFGSVLLEKVRVIARLEVQAEQEIAELRRGSGQLISVGCGDAWWRLFVQQAIDGLLAGIENPSLYIENGSNLHCMWKLLSGEVMISIGHRIDNLALGLGVEFVPLFPVIDAVYVSKDHPLADKTIREEELSDLVRIYCDPMDNQYRHILTVEGRDGLPRRRPQSDQMAHYSNSLATCVDLVRKNAGYLCYPIDMKNQLSQLGLTTVELAKSLPRKDMGIYYLTELQGDAQIEALLAHVKLCADEYVKSRLY